MKRFLARAFYKVLDDEKVLKNVDLFIKSKSDPP